MSEYSWIHCGAHMCLRLPGSYIARPVHRRRDSIAVFACMLVLLCTNSGICPTERDCSDRSDDNLVRGLPA